MKTVKQILNAQMKNAACATVAMLALTAGAYASSSEGGGHNGPDLSGPSIPLNVDRIVNELELDHSVSTCALSMFEEVASQILKDSIPSNSSDSKEKTYVNYDVYRENSQGSWSGGVSLTSEGGKQVAIQVIFEGTTSEPTLKISVSAPETAEDYDIYNWNKIVVLETHHLPYVKFTSTEQPDQISIDDLGRVISRSSTPHLVSNFRLYLPEILNQSEPLYNSDTKNITKITVDMQRYADCIKASIQR